MPARTHSLACRAARLIVHEIGYLPVVPGGNRSSSWSTPPTRKGAMILTSNRGFAERGDVFGDPVVATALLDRLLHHAIVIQIEDRAIAFASTPTSSRSTSAAERRSPRHPRGRHAAAGDRQKKEPRSTRRLITDTLPTRDFSSGTSRQNSIGVSITI